MGQSTEGGRGQRARFVQALLLAGAALCTAGSPWDARGAQPPDRGAFALDGWAAEDALAFDPFHPYEWLYGVSPSELGSATEGALAPSAALDSRPPIRIPYRPPLRTPYKPPWP